jgi:hypothetical protein
MLRFVPIIGLAIALVISAVIPESVACAATANNLQLLVGATVIDIEEDAFYNYDFDSKTVSATNCDFPVTMVFCQNATVNKVKDMLWGNASIDSEKHIKLWDDYVGCPDCYSWHSNKGTKDYTSGQFRHLRPYGVPSPHGGSSHLNNAIWGEYCIATTHHDYPPYYGWSESAENSIDSKLEDAGYLTLPDYYDFQNYEPPRVQRIGVNFHVWNNDGFATLVFVF